MPNILCSVHEVWLEHWRSVSNVLSVLISRRVCLGTVDANKISIYIQENVLLYPVAFHNPRKYYGSTNTKCPDKSALRNNIAQVNAVAVVKENTAQG